MIPCPACGGYLRQRKTKGGHRTRCCLRCHKRYRTEEVILHEIGTMTEERLIRFMSERKGWQSYETIGRHFCVTPSTAQTATRMLHRTSPVADLRRLQKEPQHEHRFSKESPCFSAGRSQDAQSYAERNAVAQQLV